MHLKTLFNSMNNINNQMEMMMNLINSMNNNIMLMMNRMVQINNKIMELMNLINIMSNEMKTGNNTGIGTKTNIGKGNLILNEGNDFLAEGMMTD